MRLKTKSFIDTALGITTEILYALVIMTIALLTSFLITLKK